MKKDGWVMVHHPEMGLLLEAVSEIEDSTEENSAGVTHRHCLLEAG